MHRKAGKYCLRLALIFLIYQYIALSQSKLNFDSSDTGLFKKTNQVFYSFDKIVNTYLFRGNANIDYPVFWGNFWLNQKYTGTAIKTTTNSFWDDEALNFGSKIRISDKFSGVISQSLIFYSTDSKSSLNKIIELRSLGGLNYSFSDNSFFETSYGYEKNEQRSTSAIGPVINIKGKFGNYDLEQYIINATANTEYVGLNDGRRRSLIDIRSSLSREFDRDNNLRIDAKYKSFLYPESFSDVEINSIKYRYENDYNSNLNFNFGIVEHFSGMLNLFIEDKDISHSHNRFVSGSPETGIKKNRNELLLNIAGEVTFSYNDFYQSAGISYNTRDERNITEEVFDISDIEYSNLQKLEKILDNASSLTQLKTQSLWNISNRDSVDLHLLVSLFRYDTPSDEINDDRDEFSTMISLRYSHRFSDILIASLVCETQMSHYVYLKSQKSANNHWYRSVRFGPTISIKTKKLSMNTRLDLLANYYSFDFEDLSPGVDSYSIRYINCEDSTSILLGRNLSLQTKIKLRYYEQGMLFWNAFAESPQNSSNENFFKALVFYNYDSNILFGFGARYFLINQKNIGIYSANSNNYYQFSYAPETNFTINFNSGLSLEFRGWYEFQKTKNDKNFREIPNLLLLTRINI